MKHKLKLAALVSLTGAAFSFYGCSGEFNFKYQNKIELHSKT